jgi:hypothetical protein
MVKENDANLLTWLQEWYFAQCGDENTVAETVADEPYQWAHGIKIDTLDNPGWTIKIDLANTLLHTKPFNKVEVDNDDPDDGNDWYMCHVEDKVFYAHCGPLHLTTVIGIFKDWASE